MQEVTVGSDRYLSYPDGVDPEDDTCMFCHCSVDTLISIGCDKRDDMRWYKVAVCCTAIHPKILTRWQFPLFDSSGS